MEFVRERTTIPVPTVLDHLPGSWGKAAQAGTPWFTLMTALPGRPLFQHGQPTRLGLCTEEQRKKMARVLSGWLDQLRSIRPPHPQNVSGFLGGPLLAYRIDMYRRVGPFNSPAEFHAQEFCTVYPECSKSKWNERVERLVKERPTKEYRICLTHGDILPHNILADEDFNLTGLIDWETAGWMPEYWERASSWRSWFSHWYGWVHIVPEAFPEYEDDMELEARIQDWHDPN